MFQASRGGELNIDVLVPGLLVPAMLKAEKALDPNGALNQTALSQGLHRRLTAPVKLHQAKFEVVQPADQ